MTDRSTSTAPGPDRLRARLSAPTARMRYASAALALSIAAAAGAAATAAPVTGDEAVALSAAADSGTQLELGSGLLDAADTAGTKRRSKRASRSDERREVPEAVGNRYTTVDLNVRTQPEADAKVVTVLAARTKVAITGERDDDWQQILLDGKARWVAPEYLAKKKPPAPAPAISSAPCDSGSAVEQGLNANAIAVHRAVCNRWPAITSYGGVRGGGGYHAQGRALDIMVRGSTGDEIAAWLRSNAAELGVMEIIWEQRIWTVQRASDGWRWMSDRGGDTANHYDHVHVSVY